MWASHGGSQALSAADKDVLLFTPFLLPGTSRHDEEAEAVGGGRHREQGSLHPVFLPVGFSPVDEEVEVVQAGRHFEQGSLHTVFLLVGFLPVDEEVEVVGAGGPPDDRPPFPCHTLQDLVQGPQLPRGLPGGD